jgi:hypothetical protein
MMTDVTMTAQNADMIVDGYAFEMGPEDRVTVTNLGRPNHVGVFCLDGTVLETSMDDIEVVAVQNHLRRNVRFLEPDALEPEVA